MAYILKAGKSILNPYDGSANSTAYGITDNLEMDKGLKQIRFTLNIYFDRAARVANRPAMYTYDIRASDPQFTAYFSPSLTTTIWAQMQAYLVATGLPAPLVIADWKVDPQAEP